MSSPFLDEIACDATHEVALSHNEWDALGVVLCVLGEVGHCMGLLLVIRDLSVSVHPNIPVNTVWTSAHGCISSATVRTKSVDDRMRSGWHATGRSRRRCSSM